MDFLDVIFPILPMCVLLILVMLMGIAFNALWLKIMYRRIRACPGCGAKAAGEIIDTDEIVIANNVDYRRLKPTRLKETKITDHFRCEACQHTWERSFTRRERIPIDKENIRK